MWNEHLLDLEKRASPTLHRLAQHRPIDKRVEPTRFTFKSHKNTNLAWAPRVGGLGGLTHQIVKNKVIKKTLKMSF